MMKNLFTNIDYNNIKLHDCKIHAIAFDDIAYRLYFDIDYISRWIAPVDDNDVYAFEITPTTLVFNNVWDIIFDIESNLPLEISSILRSNPQIPRNKEIIPDYIEYDWTIELYDGTITFKSIDFKLINRSLPKITNNQFLSIEERGGISFI
ncbi:MAG: hypothetical protein WBG43_09950 [Marinifilaceae bacterium]